MTQDGRHQVMIPPDEWEGVVLSAQRRIYKETGKVMTAGMVARGLMRAGFAVGMQEIISDVLSSPTR